MRGDEVRLDTTFLSDGRERAHREDERKVETRN